MGIWTIGWGHVIPYKGEWLRGAQNKAVARALYPGGITRTQAEALLRGDLIDTAASVASVASLVAGPVSDGQFGALVAFAFNVGTGALGKSTPLRKLNAGDVAGAADQFLMWNKGRIGGVLQVLPCLTRWRKAERALFLDENWRAAGAVRSGRKRGKTTRARTTPRARTTTPKAPPPARSAARPGRRTGR